MDKNIPSKLKRYLEFLGEYISEKGYQPSDREAARELDRDKSTIVSYKKKLEEMGLIKRTKQGRSIEILDNDYISKLAYARVSKSVIKGENTTISRQGVKLKGLKKTKFKPNSKEAILAQVLLTLYQIYDKLDVVGLEEMIPVPVELILQDEGYASRKDILQSGISGLLLMEDKVIVINSQDSLQRQRFTIAHEIGHIKLHSNKRKLGDIICASDTSQKETINREEWEADYFAANLLVPLDRLKEYVRSLNIKGEKKDVERLARMVSEKFNVSFSVAKTRLEKIGISNTKGEMIWTS